MTQALAVRDFLVDAGHRVVAVFLGASPRFPAPAYFTSRIQSPVTTFQAPMLVPDRHVRGMTVGHTAAHNIRRVPTYVAEGFALRRELLALRPDVVVNFFDMIAGFVHLASLGSSPPPRVAIAHSYLLDHPGTAGPPPGSRGRLGLALLSRITALGVASPIGLSFDELPTWGSVRVAPPLLRRGLERLNPVDGGYLLAYALNAGYARTVAAWQARNPTVAVHCYVSGGGRGLDLPAQPGLHLHELDDVAFLDHMAGCRAYVGTSGFESLCEAFYLGKPILAAPVERHYEQAFNAADASRAGVARAGGLGDLDAFWRSLPVPAPARVETFRSWVARGPELIVRAVEEAARGAR